MKALTRVAVAAAAILVAAAVVLVARFRRDPSGFGLIALLLVGLSVPLVGAAAVRADRRNPVGWMLLACGVSMPLAVTAFIYSHAAYDGADLPGRVWAAWLDGWPWTPALVLVPTVGLLLFPTGRPASRRWRPVVWIAVFVVVTQLLNELFAPHLLDYPHVANPTALPGVAGSIADAFGATIGLVPILVTVAAVAVTRRPKTDALRIVVPAAWAIVASWWACGLAVVLTGNSNDDLGAELAGLAVLGIAAWIAIRRYGLFDARRVLSNSLSYAALSVCVLAVYLGVAAAVTVIATPAVRGPLAALAAVLVAVPLRTVLQRATTRLVYGYRDDPYRVLDGLGRQLAGTIAPDDVLPSAAASIRDALRLPYVAIHIGATVAASGVPAGRTEEFPLVVAGETIGTLRVDEDEPLNAAQRALLGTVAGQVATAGHAVMLSRDLQASRERLVVATAEERRRLRRDLHDGLGPSLAGIVLGLQRVRRQVDDAPAGQLDTLTQQTKDAIAEVRRLVYNLRPPALDELGLIGALSEHATTLGGITVDGPAEVPPLPAAVEVAAYRIAVEAMTNVIRHARAQQTMVTVRIDDAVRLEIADDGEGLPTAYRAGVGITSMRERAAEVGGSCTVAARDPRGTLVSAMIPLVVS
ncbi:MAG TPA: histidine kinase [Micromonosporaceae bacterium]